MIKINLLKPQKKEVVRPGEEIPEVRPGIRPERPNLIIYVFVVVFLLMGGLFYFQHRAINKEKDLLAKAREEKKKLEHIVKDLQELQNKKMLLEKKIELVNKLKSQQEAPVIMMDELSKNLPDWVWLTSVKFKSNKLEIKGKSLSNNLIADYISNLERSPYFANVNLVDSSQRKIGGEPVLEFTLTSDFGYQSNELAKANQGK